MLCVIEKYVPKTRLLHKSSVRKKSFETCFGVWNKTLVTYTINMPRETVRFPNNKPTKPDARNKCELINNSTDPW